METIHKSYAAFLKNTVDPMLDKLGDVLAACERQGIPVDRDSLSEAIEKLFIGHMFSLLVEWTFRVIIAALICFTVYKVL